MWRNAERWLKLCFVFQMKDTQTNWPRLSWVTKLSKLWGHHNFRILKNNLLIQSQRYQPKFLRSDFCDVNLHSGMWRNAERGFWNYVFWMDMSSVAEDQRGGVVLFGNCGDFLVKSNPPLLTWSPSFGCLLPSPGLNTAFIKPPGPISLFFLQSINRLRKGKLSKARNSEPRRRIEGVNKSTRQNNAAHTWGFPWHQTFCLQRGPIRPLPSLPPSHSKRKEEKKKTSSTRAPQQQLIFLGNKKKHTTAGKRWETDQGLVEERERERERESQTETGKENAKIILSNFRLRGNYFQKKSDNIIKLKQWENKKGDQQAWAGKDEHSCKHRGSCHCSRHSLHRRRKSSETKFTSWDQRSHCSQSLASTKARESERAREKGPLFFFGKQIGKIFGNFLFSSLNSTNFARFLENSPNFRYEKIEKKEPCSSQGFFFLAKVSELEICFFKMAKSVYWGVLLSPKFEKHILIQESPYFSSEC